MFLPIHVALPHVKAGKLVALAIGSDKRHPLLPQVPTLAEARAGKVNVDMWYGIFAPPGTSPELVARLNRELKDILAAPEVRAAFETQGMDPATSTPGGVPPPGRAGRRALGRADQGAEHPGRNERTAVA